MLLLERDFDDRHEPSDLVLIHYRVDPGGTGGEPSREGSAVMVPAGTPGVRRAILFLPYPPEGGRIALEYFFSALRGGDEWFSPAYRIFYPGGDEDGAFRVLPETEGGNPGPAPGWGFFRLLLPLREEERAAGSVRIGFGAMRKKPSTSLCRLSLPAGEGWLPLAEIPEALASLKGRPMPYFLYRVAEPGGELRPEKITSARVTWTDESGDAVLCRLFWAQPGWNVPNLTPMEAKGFSGPEYRSSGYPFGDRETFLRGREVALGRLPVPRTFEGFLFGPSGSGAEYCFLVLRRHPDGRAAWEWRNRDGGNWGLTL